MSNTPIQTVSTTADKLKITLAAIAALAGVVGFYVLVGRPDWMRGAALVGGLVVAALFFLISESGRGFIAYAKESVRETRKVVWPSRKEAMQITAVVFGFVVVMAIFLWGADKLLELVLYDLILGWK